MKSARLVWIVIVLFAGLLLAQAVKEIGSTETSQWSDTSKEAAATDEQKAWLNKGMAALKARDSAAAAPMFEKALVLKTARPALAYYGRAIVNEDSGRIREAYADLQRARELEPRWALPGEELKRYVVRD